MSTPETTTDLQPATKPQGFQQTLLKRVSTAAGVILLLIGALRAYNAFVPSLPGCTSDSAKSAIQQIFKDKNVELSGLTNQRSITDSSSEKTCQADFTTPAEAGTLAYRISWQNNEAEVRVTKVDTHQR